MTGRRGERPAEPLPAGRGPGRRGQGREMPPLTRHGSAGRPHSRNRPHSRARPAGAAGTRNAGPAAVHPEPPSHGLVPARPVPEPRSERRRAQTRHLRPTRVAASGQRSPGPVQRRQRQRSPQSSGCAESLSALPCATTPGSFKSAKASSQGTCTTLQVAHSPGTAPSFITRTASPKVQISPQCSRYGVVSSSGLLSARKLLGRVQWRLQR